MTQKCETFLYFTKNSTKSIASNLNRTIHVRGELRINLILRVGTISFLFFYVYNITIDRYLSRV